MKDLGHRVAKFDPEEDVYILNPTKDLFRRSEGTLRVMKKLTLLLIPILFIPISCFASDVKDADLAGQWYPAPETELRSMLDKYLAAAEPGQVEGRIFAVISPHAGYQFSGPIAAYGFKLLQARANIKTVIVIGFSHRKHFKGIAIYDRGSFSTPLGNMAVDTNTASAIEAQGGSIYFNPAAFEEENSIEMQVPFIQMVLKDAKVVPIAFGGQSYDDALMLADALASALKDRKDYVIIASTDLSHYHPYDEAKAIDEHLIRVLDRMKSRELYDEAVLGVCELCGVMPVTATLGAAERLGFNKIKILKYANSGDTYGNRERVVGYLSAAIYDGESRGMEDRKLKIEDRKNIEENKAGGEMLNNIQRKRLLKIARESIVGFVRDGKRKQFIEEDPILNKEMGAFVTLHERSELRGCIGNMTGHGPLYKTVADMAIEAATGDPRFSTLSPKEIDAIDIEISVLSPLKKVNDYNEIRIPGNGVIVKKGFRSGVYLPQVATETGWTRDEFLTSLCAHKAGLEPDAWKDPSTELFIFNAEVFGEKDTEQSL